MRSISAYLLFVVLLQGCGEKMETPLKDAIKARNDQLKAAETLKAEEETKRSAAQGLEAGTNEVANTIEKKESRFSSLRKKAASGLSSLKKTAASGINTIEEKLGIKTAKPV